VTIAAAVVNGQLINGRYLRFYIYPDVFSLMAGLAIGYWWLVTRYGPAHGFSTTRRQKVWWYCSVGTMFVFAEWPIHPLAEHYSYAIHMLEHESFVMAAAPMMLLGIPDWMMRWGVVQRPWYRVVRFFSGPFMAGVTYSAVLLLTHAPMVVNEATHNEPFHFTAHLVLFFSGLAFWMPLINRMPEFARLSRPTKILYLFITSIPTTLPTMMLIFTTHVLYSAYAGWPQYLGWSNKVDQELAGAIMGVVVNGFVWCLAGYEFFKWWDDEQRLDPSPDVTALPDDLTWADVEQAIRG
jgi:putative membrane protein